MEAGEAGEGVLPTITSDPPYPWGTGRAELPDPEVLGQEPVLRNFQVTAGRKGTVRSDPGEQEEEPEKNATTREKNTTSGAKKEVVTDMRTAREQEDIWTPVTIREKGGPGGNTPKPRPRSGKSVASAVHFRIHNNEAGSDGGDFFEDGIEPYL
ncbi:hypothetical protein NDU88_001824 [Pleurodeles waltl]|uniref:Uncharacterized protein n=1 Tax=Pleurodeles waltl TaxID=8319 RepID=A0AAV7NG87_PLEWA|nr:hypothetical protein NDU88_001824 [Pleurodeles waltl]